MIYNPKIEKMSIEKQKEMQWRRLKKCLVSAYQRSKFYKEWFKRRKINPQKIKNFEDYQKLPLMDKFQILERDPFDFIACSEKELQAIFSSGGTSGHSKLILSDYESLNFSITQEGPRFFAAMGLTKTDRIALLNTMGIAPAGSKLLMATIHYGAMVIPIGSGMGVQFTSEIMKKMKATMFWSSAAGALALTKGIVEIGLNPKKDFCIKKIVCSGMPLPDSIRSFLEKEWEAEVFMAAGATEFGFLGFECSEHNGMHITPDYIYWEILDPQTHKPVPEGEIGESVCSGLRNYAFPLFRYQVNDLVKMSYQKCGCGRTSPRIWIVGRTYETIFIGAHKVYGFQIDEVLRDIEGISGNYQLRVKEDRGKTIFDYKIETLKPEQIKKIDVNKVKNKLENLSVTFWQGIQEGRFRVVCELVPPDTLPRTERDKIKDKIIDTRKLL
jgi:phenylacetate-CoA ligase